VRISGNKEIVATIYPDNSKIIDDKKGKVKIISNKNGISTIFNVENNIFLDKDVKYHFSYGNDLIF